MSPRLADETNQIAQLAPMLLLEGVVVVSQTKLQLNPILGAVHLTQSIVQAAWEEQPLLQLPHFTPALATICSRRR
jgi:hypothetical protein